MTLVRSDASALLAVDLQQGLLPAIDGAGEVVGAAAWLAGIAEALGVPVHATEQYPERLGGTHPAVARRVPEGQRHAKMCFAWTGEGAERRPALPEQVVVAGTEAHVCVLQTALGLQREGHEVFIVADAVGSRRASDRILALERLRAAGVTVVGAEMVAFEWLERAGTDSFRRVLPWLREGWRAEAIEGAA